MGIQKNLYHNSFNTNIASIAFTGYGIYKWTKYCLSPEFTTNGMLAKSWRRIKNNILLYKSGTEGFANSGLEPYSEYYASQIAKTMDLHYVDYGLSKWKGKLCSTCLLFTNENVSYIPVGRIIKTGGIESVIDYYKKLGESYYQELLDMLVFDAVILNEDRHFGNFGFLIDNNQIKLWDVRLFLIMDYHFFVMLWMMILKILINTSKQDFLQHIKILLLL